MTTRLSCRRVAQTQQVRLLAAGANILELANPAVWSRLLSGAGSVLSRATVRQWSKRVQAASGWARAADLCQLAESRP